MTAAKPTYEELLARVAELEQRHLERVPAPVVANAALRETEEQYRQVVERASDGIVVHTGQKIVFANPAFAAMSGYSPAELDGIDCLKLVPPEQHQLVADRTRRRLEGEKVSNDYGLDLLRKDGTAFSVEVRASAINYHNEPHHLVILRDITERKRAEQELREGEEKFRLLFESAGDAIFVLDAERRILAVNNMACEQLGYTHAELTSMTVGQVDTPEEAQHAPGRMARMLEQGSISFQTVHRRKDGSSIPTEVRARLITWNGKPAVISIARDITERKRAEEALRGSEQKYRAYVENTGDVIFETDSVGRLLFISPQVQHLSGYAPEELVGTPFFDLLAPGQVQRLGPLFAEAVATGSQALNIENILVAKDGRRLVMELSAVPFFDSQGSLVGFRGINRDITERKRADDALRERDFQFAKLTSRVPGMIYQFTRRPDGTYRVPFTTEAIQDIFGCSPQDVREDFSPIARVILPEDLGAVVDSIEASAKDLSAWTCEYRVKLPGQPTRWMFGNATPEKLADGSVTWHGFNTDITERKRAEDALRESEEKYRELFDAAADLISVVDLQTNFIALNKKFEDESEWSKAEMLNQSVLTSGIVTPESSLKIAEYVSEIVAGRSVPIFEVTGVTKSGKKIPYELRAVPLRRSGEIVAIQAILRNLTERKSAEAEKAALEARLQQAQRMESVGRLAGGIAHDFNNMLSIILANVGFALEQVDPSEPIRADLEEVRTAAKRSAELVRQLLAFASKQTVAPRVLDLNGIVGGMLAMLRRLIGEDIKLVWLPGENLWPVKVDPSQIDQILANLCVNARDAVSDVGTVTVETGNSTLDEEYCVNHAGHGQASGEYVRLTVTDTGCGMDKDTLSHLFEPFFTTKETGKGTGLGLATVYGIVQQNDGFIDVVSEPGQGTTVTIYLPQHVGRTVQGRSGIPAGPEVRGHETILLVEDEPAILKATKRMLDQHGYTVLGASTAGEAIRLAKEHAGEIHLLITDVVMPEMNGRDLAKNLLSLYPEMKRLFMSGYTANVIAHHGVLDEGVQFLQKPFSAQELAAKVREALDSG
jgi:two-component system, cell cycle sensor histidine kinase and response regulator CckA